MITVELVQKMDRMAARISIKGKTKKKIDKLQSRISDRTGKEQHKTGK